ncbi:hypothetical protein L6R52_20480 [Myxococcota bacterium]|nr:hypothetical protein [Myxococcota bacterium]
MRVWAVVLAALASLAGCAGDAWIELQIADDRLPFLEAGVDFDALGVRARAADCAPVESTYPAAPLPATVIVLPGDCYGREVDLSAFATKTSTRVAESGWIPVTFPDEGAFVATATLTALAPR